MGCGYSRNIEGLCVDALIQIKRRLNGVGFASNRMRRAPQEGLASHAHGDFCNHTGLVVAIEVTGEFHDGIVTKMPDDRPGFPWRDDDAVWAAVFPVRHGFEHFGVIFGFLLLRPDESEVKHHDQQDQGHEAGPKGWRLLARLRGGREGEHWVQIRKNHVNQMSRQK